MERAKAKKKKTDEGQNAALDKVFGDFDLLTAILVLLPLKELVRLKTVSSHWLNLISNPLFLVSYARQYRKTHPALSFSQFYCNYNPISFYGSCKLIPELDCVGGVGQYASNSTKYGILYSCNGLILSKYYYDDSLVVFNPTTNKHRSLPNFAHCHERNTVLAFDPLISPYYNVISFDCLPCDQKMHLLKSDKIRQHCMIDIFSSKSASWKRIFLPAPSVGVTTSKRVFWNGAIHWISDKNFHVRFDVNEENFTWNKIPIDANTFPEGHNIGYMGECDTGLLLIKFSRNSDSLKCGQESIFTILEMKKNSDCWVPKHHVNLEKLLPEMGLSGTRETFKYIVLHVLSESNKDSFSLVLEVLGKIILCSINNKNNHISTKVLEDLAAYGTHNSVRGDFFPFIPCWAPV